MDEYVKRAAIDFPFLNSGRIIDGELYVSLNEIYSEVKKLPAADVAPVIRGHWIRETYTDRHGDLCYRAPKCSHCGNNSTFTTTYCSDCGAKMDKEARNEQSD